MLKRNSFFKTVTKNKCFYVIVHRYLKDLTQHIKEDHDKPERRKKVRAKKEKSSNSKKKKHAKHEIELLPYKCEFCSKRFKLKAKLLAHLTYELSKSKPAAHEDHLSPSNDEELAGNGRRRQMCKVCSKQISGSLRRHLGMTHQIVIPYQCKLCPNIRFSYRPNFQAHVEHSHSALTVFHCLEKTFVYL